EPDKQALLAFKSKVDDDPFGALSTWNDSVNFCQWLGVTCSLKYQRVILLNLSGQNLTGTASPYIGNLTFLRLINLQQNNFSSNIPHEIGRLFRLRHIIFNSNALQGQIPDSRLILNKLEGNIPSELGSLLKFKGLGLANNYFTGPIPHLNMFQVSVYSLTGSIPIQLLNITSMEYFHVSENQLVGELPPHIGFTLPNVRILLLAGNQFFGNIPHSISNASKLEWLDFANNSLTGLIPEDLDSLVNCTYLEVVSLSVNSLSGTLPNSLANFSSHLRYLYMSANPISGSIPTEIGNLKNLIIIAIEKFILIRNIPISVGYLLKLQVLSLFENNISREIPSSLGNFTFLTELNLCGNSIRGSVPSALGSCHQLWLDLSHNHLTGPIPLAVGNPKSIPHLDLSKNELSGEIPSSLAWIFGYISIFAKLNLSYNNLDGDVPRKMIFKNASAISEAGNEKLCGGISELKLPPCTPSELKKREKSKGFKLMILLLSGLVGLILVMSLLIINRLRRQRTVTSSESSSRKDLLLNVSYESLVKATVYKGILDLDQTFIAVKVLFLHQRGALKSFMAECQALRNIRHRNLVKIITACSTSDFQGNYFRALVYEFMHHGSLESCPRILSFLRRLNIAIDVASALEYLHHHCKKPIVHCDLKPSNVLLDNDMTAHMGDFGLTRFIPEVMSSNQCSSVGLKGTVGYATPEYGILLLEIFTGKRPTSDMFTEGLDLHNFVKMALPDQILQVLDPLFLVGGVQEGEETAEENIKKGQIRESLIAIL
ncbi:hypothetical protein CISIN_1g041479mg, partial [Citrus sinensis]